MRGSDALVSDADEAVANNSDAPARREPAPLPPTDAASPAETNGAAPFKTHRTFAAFFEREWPNLIKYLRRSVGRAEAEEIAQEAFSRLYAFDGDIREPERALFRTARNLVIDGKRRTAIVRLIPAGDETETIPDPHASPEEEAYWRQELENVTRMINRMAPKCRKIFLMQVMHDLSYAEIATAVGMSVPGVKKHLLKAFDICADYAATEGDRPRRRGLKPKRKDR